MSREELKIKLHQKMIEKKVNRMSKKQQVHEVDKICKKAGLDPDVLFEQAKKQVKKQVKK
jgi:hypothetical protein